VRPRPESTQGDLLQIGAAAKCAGLSLRTVRYYGDAGLVRPSARTNGGFRLYCRRDIERLRAVKRMKPLRLLIGEMGELLGLLNRSTTPELIHEGELAFVVDSLGRYAAQTDASVDRLERELGDAKELAGRIGERIARVDRAGRDGARR
jgi:DNA-binding transcriptional MerR regulator